MVTAGVYLVVRLSALFALAPATMLAVAVVAALTAFVAGTIALTQQDIKKVLAYSTVSQLGYMFLACGVGAFAAGIFHVFTHAFFKACLFLGAGSIIHACHHIQDLDRMGGLRKHMPTTRWTFLVACLAIAGVPPLAGFVSKDEILWKTFESGHLALWGLALLTALMTAGYCFRAYFLAFEGPCRLPHDVEHHAHESPKTMTIPLVLLAIGAVVAGALNLPPLIGHGHLSLMNNFLDPVVAPAREIMEHAAHAARAAHAAAGHEAAHSLGLEIGLVAVSVAVAALGIALAWWLCLRVWPEGTRALTRRLGPLYRLSFNRWWWDDFYNRYVAGGLRATARAAVWFDRWIIDGLLHTLGGVARLASGGIRWLQNGQVQAYALAILIGVNLIIILALWF
jgi:NADH-quinone oxidoreductase subunit L